MYFYNEEKPTNELRLKHKIPDVTAVIQQKGSVRKGNKTHYEWRDIPKVGTEAPDIEHLDENPNLCD